MSASRAAAWTACQDVRSQPVPGALYTENAARTST